MEMPRYKPNEVRAVSGDAIKYQGEAQLYGTIEQKLGEWQNFLYKKGATIATAKGKEQGTLDAMQGKVKIEDDNNILGNTFYDEAYKDAAYTTYGIQTELDAKNYAELAKLQANGDPEAFKASFDKYQSTVMAEAPNEHMRGIASSSFQKYGMKEYVAIHKERINKVDKQNRNIFEDGVKLIKDQIVEAYSYGRDDEALKLSGQLASLFNRGIEQQWTTEEDAILQSRELQRESIKGRIYEDFRTTADKKSFIKQVEQSKQLEADEKLTVVGKLKSIMSEELREQRANQEVFQKKVTSELQNATEILNNGKLPENLSEVEKYANTGLATDGALARYQIAKEAYNIQSGILSLPLDEQEKEIAKYKANPKATVSEIKAYERAEQNLNAKKALVKKDPMLAATQDGIVKNLVPVSLDDLSQLSTRIEQGKKAQSAYGTSDLKVFTDTELTAFKSFVDNPDTKINDKLSLISEIQSKAGKDSMAIFKQIEEKGAYSFAMSGYLMSQGQNDTATDLMKGVIVRKEYPNIIPKDLGSAINTRLGNALSHTDEGTRKSYIEAITNVYASNAEKNGKLNPEMASVTDMDNAIVMVIGGKVVDYNGKKILPPKFEMKQPLFGTWVKDWIDDMKPESITVPPKGVTSQEFIDYLDDAQLENAGEGKYFVKYGGKYFQTQDGKKYVLEYTK
ncbi:MAG: hypothetical protein EOL95_09990 [Bacteroidia bacterium]|nr:hypothetical protein [Bacteroidia bacterium]